jgi:hypothetical protein
MYLPPFLLLLLCDLYIFGSVQFEPVSTGGNLEGLCRMQIKHGWRMGGEDGAPVRESGGWENGGEGREGE